MKKRIITALCLLMAVSCFVLVGCGSSSSSSSSAPQDLTNSKYLGTWKAVSLTMGDKSGAIDQEMLLVLNADGTAAFTSENETDECKWQETSDGIKLTDGVSMEFKADGDALITSVFGTDLRFEKQA